MREAPRDSTFPCHPRTRGDDRAGIPVALRALGTVRRFGHRPRYHTFRLTTMPRTILAIALALPDVYDAGETATLLTRHIRAADPSIGNRELVSVPWLDGSRGTLDFLVTHTLGSFLEVEATSASGEEVVAPIGFAGEDGKLAIIEMSRVAGVERLGKPGTTAGVGQLIQDALDEGAFSIVLCQEEPLAADAGFGAAAALGVRFFHRTGEELDYLGTASGAAHGEAKHHPLSEIARVDTSGRSFALLSSRLFLARSQTALASRPTRELSEELGRLAEIIERDTGILPSGDGLSASAIEFGLVSLLGAEVRDGFDLVLEASQIEQAIARGEFSHALVLAPSEESLIAPRLRPFVELVQRHVTRCAILIQGPVPKENGESHAARKYSLEEVPLFQAPLRVNASLDERRRDFALRLEKLMPKVLEEWKHANGSRPDDRSSEERSPSEKARPSRERRA